MQLKTFSARSTAQILAQIKEELGPDAIILETREEDGLITMTAALERGQPDFAGGQAARAASLPARAKSPAAKAGRSRATGEPAHAGSGGALPASAYSGPVLDSAYGAGPGMYQTGLQQWQEEWGQIKHCLLTLMKPALKLGELPPRQRLAIEFLQREGLDDETVLDLFTRLQKDADASILAPLGQMVTVRPWGTECWPQQIQFVAGPFGAGKTSVAIRMALHLRGEDPDLRVCLVNADATRGNGRLLLRHYSELSDMAYKEASSTMELVAALHAARKEGFDRILVDLPGLARGHFLHTLLADAGFPAPGRRRNADDIAVHLALPPHYGGLQLRAMLERYRTGHSGSLVWTKLDEAEHFGQIVNVGLAAKLPVSALSYGPGLGNSLAPAQSNILWRLLFKRELPG